MLQTVNSRSTGAAVPSLGAWGVPALPSARPGMSILCWSRVWFQLSPSLLSEAFGENSWRLDHCQQVIQRPVVRHKTRMDSGGEPTAGRHFITLFCFLFCSNFPFFSHFFDE